MKCEYVKLNWQHEYPMPNDEDAVLVRHLMEDLADKIWSNIIETLS